MMTLDTLHWLLGWRGREYYAPWPFGQLQPKPRTIPVIARDLAFHIAPVKSHRVLGVKAQTRLDRARMFLWWMEGRDYPEHDPGLAMICKSARCIAPAHTVLADSPMVYAPPPKPPPPPVLKLVPPIPEVTRAGCISAKLRYPTEQIARQTANQVIGRRQYAYKCDLPGCGGWHLTKIKPGKYVRKKVGVW